jgi:dihydrofolate reductase
MMDRTDRAGRGAKLTYMMLASLDGYVADAEGKFDWAEPDEQVLTFINDLVRPFGTYLYGRRMYDLMSYWETAHTHTDQPACVREFGEIWQAADKIVYSKTLDAVSTGRTRIERDFDPAAVRELKQRARSDLGIGGPELAALALGAGLVDECQLFVAPMVVGAGKPWLPQDVRFALELLHERRFEGGMVYLHYRCKLDLIDAQRWAADGRASSSSRIS